MRCGVPRVSHSSPTLKEKCAGKDVGEKEMKNSRRREIVGVTEECIEIKDTRRRINTGEEKEGREKEKGMSRRKRSESSK
jgi:hypothetical protein